MLRPLTVAWISDFPIEWLPDAPQEIRQWPRQHALTWQRVLLEEFKERKDLKLHIICLRKQIDRDFTFEWHGVVFHVLKTMGGIRLASLFWQDTFLIRQALRKINPDLVHAWGTERGAALVAERLGYPFLITMQGLLEWCAEMTPMPFYFRLMVFFERYTLRRAKTVTVESSFGRHYLQKKYPKLVLYQAEHAPARSFHEVVRRPETLPRRFLFVGTLGTLKGTNLLLTALDRLSATVDFRLTLVGSPLADFKPSLEKWLRSPLGERIDYKSSLTSAQIAEELARCNLLLFPTRADNSPNAVKEAVVAGVPVVASRVGGIPDYVVPEKNGLLFSPGNLDEFVQAIQSACQHPLFGRGEVDPDVLDEKRRYLSSERMGQKFREAYDLVLSRDHTVPPRMDTNRHE